METGDDLWLPALCRANPLWATSCGILDLRGRFETVCIHITGDAVYDGVSSRKVLASVPDAML
ncbi:MAG: hypothetical protein CME05_13685 [Gemmatimonadaceae bacterium]|nr:hypothetical protein [Gemmatimonadaceae bacterium]